MSQPAKLFITYAHKDKAEKDTLIECLAGMRQRREIEIWHDNEILPGDRWKEKISRRLAGSDILLYLTSRASLASENCNKELFEAWEIKKRIRTIPIILEACDWARHPISEFEALPHKGKPVNKWRHEAEGWQNVVEGIRKIVRETCPPTEEDRDESPARLMLETGNFFMMLGQSGGAIDIYSQAIKIEPDFAEAYNSRGIAYDGMGDYDQAIRDYNKAIELKSDYVKVHNNRGIAYVNKGDYENAIRDFNQAIELKLDCVEAYNNRGNACVNKGDYDQALHNFNVAITLKPDYADIYNNRGSVYVNQGKFDHAIRDYSKAIELNSALIEPYPYFNRGMVWLYKQAWDKAKADWKDAERRGANVAELFANDFGSVSTFEREYQLQLPDDIRDMLTMP